MSRSLTMDSAPSAGSVKLTVKVAFAVVCKPLDERAVTTTVYDSPLVGRNSDTSREDVMEVPLIVAASEYSVRPSCCRLTVAAWQVKPAMSE